MSGITPCAWRESALDWIEDDSAGFPWPLPTGWRPTEATAEARFLTIQVLRATPDDLPPVEMGISDGHGIAISWCKGLRELEVEVLANATLEVSTWESAELIEQASFEEQAIWRLQRLFSWLRNAPQYAH